MTQPTLDAHETQILAEQAEADERALRESTSPLVAELATELDRRVGGTMTPARNMSFSAAIAAFRRASLCPECGKSQAILNVARRGFIGERVTAATHCFCAGSPLEHLKPLGIAP